MEVDVVNGHHLYSVHCCSIDEISLISGDTLWMVMWHCSSEWFMMGEGMLEFSQLTHHLTQPQQEQDNIQQQPKLIEKHKHISIDQRTRSQIQRNPRKPKAGLAFPKLSVILKPYQTRPSCYFHFIWILGIPRHTVHVGFFILLFAVLLFVWPSFKSFALFKQLRSDDTTVSLCCSHCWTGSSSGRRYHVKSLWSPKTSDFWTRVSLERLH